MKVRLKPLLLFSILFTLPLAAWGMTWAQFPRALSDDAERIFAYDRAHPHQLPAHQLRALSLAIAFFDETGARKLVQSLKR